MEKLIWKTEQGGNDRQERNLGNKQNLEKKHWGRIVSDQRTGCAYKSQRSKKPNLLLINHLILSPKQQLADSVTSFYIIVTTEIKRQMLLRYQYS